MNPLRYLNGIDWVITGLNQLLGKTSGIGNWSQLVLELDGALDSDAFKQSVQCYIAGFPVLQGRMKRGWQLAPGWKIPRCVTPSSVFFENEILPAATPFEQVVERLGRAVCAPPGCAGQYIGFTLLSVAEKTFVAFRFDHRLMDARGAELFIDGLIKQRNGLSTQGPGAVLSNPANLRPWSPKFLSGQQVVRQFRRQQELAAPYQLEARDGVSTQFQFSLISLTKEQSDLVLNRAYDEAGYLMFVPWLAARVSCALEKFRAASGRPSLGGQVIPCSIDRRSGSPQMFFNHLSFLYLCCASEDVGTPGLAKNFSRQFYEQIQSGMPAHLENAWKLARIIPAPLFGKLLGGALKSFAGTFSLAHVGAGLSEIKNINGAKVVNAFHLPVVPPVPGVGFFVNTFDGRMNFCLTSANSVMSPADHLKFLSVLRRDLEQPGPSDR